MVTDRDRFGYVSLFIEGPSPRDRDVTFGAKDPAEVSAEYPEVSWGDSTSKQVPVVGVILGEFPGSGHDHRSRTRPVDP